MVTPAQIAAYIELAKNLAEQIGSLFGGDGSNPSEEQIAKLTREVIASHELKTAVKAIAQANPTMDATAAKNLCMDALASYKAIKASTP